MYIHIHTHTHTQLVDLSWEVFSNEAFVVDDSCCHVVERGGRRRCLVPLRCVRHENLNIRQVCATFPPTTHHESDSLSKSKKIMVENISHTAMQLDIWRSMQSLCSVRCISKKVYNAYYFMRFVISDSLVSSQRPLICVWQSFWSFLQVLYTFPSLPFSSIHCHRTIQCPSHACIFFLNSRWKQTS